MPKPFKRPSQVKNNLHKLRGQDPKRVAIDEFADVLSKEIKKKENKPAQKKGQKTELNIRPKINSLRRRFN